MSDLKALLLARRNILHETTGVIHRSFHRGHRKRERLEDSLCNVLIRAWDWTLTEEPVNCMQCMVELDD